MSCKCYHADKNFLGKIGVCWGTKECEACSCGGDETKCDFYDYVRNRGKTIEYIPRKEALAVFGDIHPMDYNAIVYANHIKSIPAADVRPVVECGKCKYGECVGIECICSRHSFHLNRFGEDATYYEYHGEHWFCADGEPKERGVKIDVNE